MLYIYHSILVLIIITIILTSDLLSVVLAQKLIIKYTHIRQYKITNWYLTLFCVYFYILFPLIGLYCLKLYNVNRNLDLKIVYRNIYDILIMCLNISYIYTILSIILLLFITITIMLSILVIYIYINNQIYNFWLFIQYNLKDNIICETISQNIQNYRNTDIISFWVIRLSDYLTYRLAYYKMNLIWEKEPDIFSPEYKRKQKLFYDYCEKRPWYDFDVILYKIIIPFSPSIIIIYDCIFNDFIITHVYYLLLYIPIMIIKRITSTLCDQNRQLGELIWDILYKKETCIYALPKDHKKLFDVYIANGIKTVNLGPPVVMDFDVSWFISKSAQFTFNEKYNIYYNGY